MNLLQFKQVNINYRKKYLSNINNACQYFYALQACIIGIRIKHRGVKNVDLKSILRKIQGHSLLSNHGT
jgi:hypothetical protein